MRPRGFWFWLVLFVSGSVLWLWPLPWAETMGRLILFVAVFIGVTAPTWRTEARFRTPRTVVGLQFANIFPMFILGWSPSPSPSQKVVYLVAGVIVLAINAYVGLSRRDEGAA